MPTYRTRCATSSLQPNRSFDKDGVCDTCKSRNVRSKAIKLPVMQAW
jgi:hypothetical protein